VKIGSSYYGTAKQPSLAGVRRQKALLFETPLTLAASSHPWILDPAQPSWLGVRRKKSGAFFSAHPNL